MEDWQENGEIETKEKQFTEQERRERGQSLDHGDTEQTALWCWEEKVYLLCLQPPLHPTGPHKSAETITFNINVILNSFIWTIKDQLFLHSSKLPNWQDLTLFPWLQE